MIAPFPWFGGKSRAAALIWQRLGNVPNYIEPFAGSLAVLLARPHRPKVETVNDLDGLLSNFWRAVKYAPEDVAEHADWPVNEADLHARHAWLVEQRADVTARLMGDADYYDAKVAGWWVWGICQWIGSGWCSGKGPWRSVDGRLVNVNGDPGMGINRKLPHLGDPGRGINRKRPHLGDPGRGDAIRETMQALAARLRDVRMCCGEWDRVVQTGSLRGGNAWPCGVLLDPPYADTAERCADLYAEDCQRVAHAVREWAIANGDNPRLRIALCGYEGEHEMPAGWTSAGWTGARGAGYGNASEAGMENHRKERVWFSPHCLRPQRGLFDGVSPEP